METTAFKVTLDWGSKKYRCPQCGKNTFVRYRDRENGEYLNDEYGRCDRQDKCGYFLQPDQPKSEKTFIPATPKARVNIPDDVFKKTLNGYNENTLFQALKVFKINENKLSDAFDKYKIGTLIKGSYKGYVCFPFINRYNQVQAIQCKKFGEDTHTVGDANWIHSILYQALKNNLPSWITDYFQNEKKVNCFFGEHLLSEDRESPVIIVESPKDAILGTILMPEYIWLASFNESFLKAERLSVVKGRKVILIPDTSKDATAFDKWQTEAEKAERLYSTAFEVSGFFEDNTTPDQKAKGYDIGDYIVDHIQEMEGDILRRTTSVKKNHTFENQTVTELHRIKVGLTFDTNELTALTRKMIPENDSRTAKELIQTLKDLEGMDKQDAEDLILTMRIKNVIDKTSLGTYFLSDSTPF